MEQPIRLDGARVSAAILEQQKQLCSALAVHGRRPGLAVVIVGDDPASHVYVRNKRAVGERTGLYVAVYTMPADVAQAVLLELIAALNADDRVDGILVQKPLPPHIDAQVVTEAIVVHKDVDGFHPYNQGQLWNGGEGFVPCTPAGVMALLDHYGLSVAGLHAVVLGRSHIVGKPMAALLLAAQATVTVCHSHTRDSAAVCRQADIVIAAIGKRGCVTEQWVRPGAIVVDVGIHRRADGTLCGDVAYDAVAPIAKAITPVPGGVGPMTIAMLIVNTVRAAQKAGCV
ncbi:MAG: bifunctional 5,10-methylenetetrahydrofolate dehydrogenase/5,10-methenyltetrahydrofolate cyclohydrolase [Paenibacillaceae bacterium]|nr:bifunctional 5,10-methylenetetrahydrofolate dehydrogenase/5,10-methenyltetrahydrofolate cyclohydrolase [Paenibacillaceae bacterium]